MMQPCTINVYTIELMHHNQRFDVVGVRATTMRDLVELLEIEQIAAAKLRNKELKKGASLQAASKLAKARDLLALVIVLFDRLDRQGYALPVSPDGKSIKVQVCDGIVLSASSLNGAEKRVCFLPESGNN